MAKSLTEKRARQRERARRREQRRERFAAHRGTVVKTVVCIVAFAVLVVPAIFVNNAIGYVPALTFLFALAVSGLYLRVSRRCLRVDEPTLQGSCIRGEEVSFSIRMHNRSPLPLNRKEPELYVSDLIGGEDQVTRDRLSLAPFETYDFNFAVRFDHIGSYSAGLKEVVVYDLVGLFSATLPNKSRHAIEVAPRVHEVGELRFDRELLKERSDSITPLSMDGSDYTGVRDYVLGDPMKSIHWKLSARGDVYYTKIFETLGTPGVEALLDFHSPSYEPADMMSVFDAVVEGGLSVGAYARAQGMDFDLVYRDKRFHDVRLGAQSISSRMSFIGTLPRITSTDRDREMLDILRRESNSAYAQRNIVVCTSSINEELVNALAAAKRRQRNPMLIAVVPPSMDSAERKEFLAPLRRLDALKISYLPVCAADEIGGVS